MEKNFILNRRTVLGGAAALGTVGVLAACGSSKDSKATTQGATVGTDAKELYDLGEAAVSELKDGGTLRLAIPGIGPDFNLFSADGNSLYTQTAMSPVAYAGLWQGDPMGKRTLAPDFAKSFDVAEENGLPVVSIELNPQAKFNDGTPHRLQGSAGYLGGPQEHRWRLQDWYQRHLQQHCFRGARR